MIRLVFIAGVIGLGIGVALAQEDPIAARKALMKANGEAGQDRRRHDEGGGAVRSRQGAQGLCHLRERGREAPALFPDSSKTGGDTAADPKIWENLPDFKARLEKLGADAKAAGAEVTDLASFKAAFGNIGKNDCGSCHQTYRVKKS